MTFDPLGRRAPATRGLVADASHPDRDARRILDALRLAVSDEAVDEATRRFYSRLLGEFRTTIGLSGTADAITVRAAMAELTADVFERVLRPVIEDVFATGWAAAGSGLSVSVPDLDRDALERYVETVGNRVVGENYINPRTGRRGGDALARQAPIADDLVEAWRTVIGNGQDVGWNPTTIREELDFAFRFEGVDGPDGRKAGRSRLARLDDVIDRKVASGGWANRNAAEADGWGGDRTMRWVTDERDETAKALRQAESVSSRTYTRTDGTKAVRPAGQIRYVDPKDGVERVRLAKNLPDDAQVIGRVRHGWEARAERIARTETVGAFNAGTNGAATEAGWARVWLATYGPRTRDSHLRADGQCRAPGESFSVNGPLRYPGDPYGPPGETVNCRCTLLVEPDGCGSKDDRRFTEALGRDPAAVAEVARRREAGGKGVPERFDPGSGG